MKKATFDQAGEFLRERRARRRRYAAISVLALAVVCATAWGLSRQGHALDDETAAMEGELDCPIEPHVHDASCYGGDGQLTCGKVQYVVHQHDKYCKDENGNLVCQLPEVEGHEHTEECFKTEEVLICGMEEGEPIGQVSSEVNEAQLSKRTPTCGKKEHTHDDSCYRERTLKCGQEAGHTHTGSCYEKTLNCSEDHEHSNECYASTDTLICKIEENHQHTDECFATGEPTCGEVEHKHTEECYQEAGTPGGGGTENGTGDGDGSGSTEGGEGHHGENCYKTVKYLVCGEEGIHVHDDSCYDGNGELICDAPEITSLPKHQHTAECFKEKEESTYTKTFMDDKLHVTVSYEETAKIDPEAELKVEEIETEEELEKYGKRLAESEDAFAETEKVGMLVRMGIYVDDALVVPEDQVEVSIDLLDKELYTEEEEITAVIFGEDGVEKISTENGSFSFEAEELPELGFIVGAAEKTLTYEGEDYIVTVTLDKKTELPENAELSVEETTRPEEKTDEKTHYEDCLAMLKEQEDVLGEKETIALLLDMDIVADGESVPLESDAEVSVQFLNNKIYFNNDKVKAAYITGDDVSLLEATDIDSEMTTTFTVSELAEAAFIVPDDIRTMTCEGDGFIVTVRFGENALIPEDAELQATQIREDSELFAEYEEKLKEHESQAENKGNKDSEEDKETKLGVLMDVGFYVDGEEIEPSAAVEVKIQMLNKKGLETKDGDGSFGVVHFAENGVETLEDVEVEDAEESLSTAFQLDSFSLLGITITGGREIKDAQAFYDAIAAAKGKTGVGIELDGTFPYPGNSGVGTAVLENAEVTLYLNGCHIKLDKDITLLQVKRGSELKIVDKGLSEDGKEISSEGQGGDRPFPFSYTMTKVSDDGSEITEEKIDNLSGGAIVGWEHHTGSMIEVDGGKLSIESGILAENGGRAIDAENGATINLSGGYLINNGKNFNVKKGDDPQMGGAIRLMGGDGGKKVDATRNTLEISRNVILASNQAWEGGAIKASNTDVTMSGGYITNNTVYSDGWAGGGIVTRDESTMTMTGGYITGNVSSGRGGGICAAQNSTLTIEKGYISGNETLINGHEGGGIAVVVGSNAHIGEGSKDQQNDENKVYITGNTSGTPVDWGGGGIFIEENCNVYMYRALITNNTADGFGGGLGGCSTGKIVDSSAEKNNYRGAAIFDNRAEGEKYAGDDDNRNYKNQDIEYTKDNKWFHAPYDYYQDFFSALYSHIEDTMLGGGLENWEGSTDYQNIRDEDGNWDGKCTSNFIAGLTAKPSPEAKASAKSQANVFIQGNHSVTHGGGIMCNGMLFVGVEGKDIETIEVENASMLRVKAVKKFQYNDKPIAMKPGQFQFTIYADEACKKVVSSAVNDKEGNVEFRTLSFNLTKDKDVVGNLEYQDTGLGKGTYTYYIKENDLAVHSSEVDPADNLGVKIDPTVYKLEVTVRRVKKTGDGVVGNQIANQIVGIALYKREKETGADGAVSYQEIYNGYDEQVDQKGNSSSKYDNGSIPTIVYLTSEGIFKDKKTEELVEHFPSDKIGEASFVNEMTGVRNIQVEKKWEGITPGANDSVTVALYRKVGKTEGDPGEGDPGDMIEEQTLSEPTGWSYTWVNLPLRSESGEWYQYSVREIGLSKGELSDYDVTYEYEQDESKQLTKVIITNAPQKAGKIKIVKTLQEGTGAGKDPVTFVFNVEAVKDGRKVYSDVFTLVFNGPGNDSITVDKIPLGSFVTVTETYTGASCTLVTDGPQTAVVETEDVIPEVKFINEYDSNRGGQGITNKYKNDGSGWNGSNPEQLKNKSSNTQ